MIKRKIKEINTKKEPTNFAELIEPFTKRWYFYILALIISLSSVYLYVRYTIPVYLNSASIIINEENGKGGNGNINVLEELELVPSSSNLMNEIEVLKSHSVLAPVVDSLDLNVTTYLIGDKSKLRRFELFDESPIKIKTKLSKNAPNIYFKIFELNFYSFNKIELISPNGKRRIYAYKDTVVFDDFGSKIIFNKSEIFSETWIGRKLEIVITSNQKAIERLRNELLIEKKNKESSVITLSIKGPNQQKNNKILSELIESYQFDCLNDKNIVKSNTSDFIKERIKFLLEELNVVEADGENYKSNKGIVDYQADLNSFLNSKGASERELLESSIQLNLVNLLYDFMTKSIGFEDLFPSNLGFEDETINSLTSQYNKLILERKKLLQNTKENNPLVIKAESQLASIKASLERSLKNVKNSYELKVKSYERQFNRYENQLDGMPKFEREYRSIIRQQQIKESLYIYLLQKIEDYEGLVILNPSETTLFRYGQIQRQKKSYEEHLFEANRLPAAK